MGSVKALYLCIGKPIIQTNFFQFALELKKKKKEKYLYELKIF